MKTIILTMTTVLLMGLLSANCAKPSFTELEAKGYTAYLKSSVFMWKLIVVDAEKAYEASEKTTEDLLEFTRLQYGLLYACLANQDKDTYKIFSDQTFENAKKLVKEDLSVSEHHALYAALMSAEMAFYPMKGMTLGSKSGSLINTAIKTDSTEAFAWKQYASSKYFTPEMFGGDLNEAISAYNKTIELYENAGCEKNWNYLDALAWLGIAYTKAEKYDDAEKTYKKALDIEPEFSWIKNHLLPSVQKKKEDVTEQ